MGSRKSTKAAQIAVRDYRRALVGLSDTKGWTYRQSIISAVNEALEFFISSAISYICTEARDGDDGETVWHLSAHFSHLGRSLCGLSKVVCSGVSLEATGERLVRHVTTVLTEKVKSARAA